MPLFEYRCSNCGETFEELVPSLDRDAVTTCRHCGSPSVQRLLSTFAVQRASGALAAAEPGPCGACGAPQRGACAMESGEW